MLRGMGECHKLSWPQKTMLFFWPKKITIFVYINPLTKQRAIYQLTLFIVGPNGRVEIPSSPLPPLRSNCMRVTMCVPVHLLPADKAIIEISILQGRDLAPQNQPSKV